MESSSNEFRPLDHKYIVEYIKATPALRSQLGYNLDDLKIREVGDGNLNFVFIVATPSASLVIKQALPYVRSMGESWSMSKERSYFEAEALREQGLYYYDRTMSVIGMRYLEPPHIVLRKGLISGIEYPLLAEHMSEFMARTLFFSSLLHLTTTQHRSSVAKFCGNVEMCRLTEQVIFSDPYRESQHSYWTSPYLDSDAQAVREDNILKLEVAELKSRFCERAQALIHGDLHTGSVMVTRDSTQVIDPEFSFYGPMGFDIGAFIGNLFLAYFAQDGHANHGNDRKLYKEWILRTIVEIWTLFDKKFTALWDDSNNSSGEAYLPEIYNNAELQLLVKRKYIKDLLHDTLGFAAAKMIRRIVGVAHVEDFESITDTATRAKCERQALDVAKMIMKERRRFEAITGAVSAIQEFHK
ncbi:hypothetical protein DCAR_0101609 [Daucus carota subsp. sativus]|uniref:S-methyl-5-thioribose kinase n=1 Tax=Daucus carota subsp. sativus TaxID=79200 RepID=A0AAF0W3A8_DAUCS|nr:hypothetical protein DCAR_0101609 [Daucus carota subsp. sativus]